MKELTKLQQEIIETVRAAGSIRKRELTVGGQCVDRFLMSLSRLVRAGHIEEVNTYEGVVLTIGDGK